MILREVGALLKSSMRENFDVAGRYGGEEFLLIFDESDVRTCFEVVERIRKKIVSHEFSKIDETGAPVKNSHLSISVSFGLAENSHSSDSDALALGRDEWISRTDQALYRAKENGRNQTQVWGS